MRGELARDSWKLPALERKDLGPYGGFPRLDDGRKREIRERYRARRPERVPVSLTSTDRVFLLDPAFNADGMRYEEVFRDPQAMLLAQLRHQYLLRMRHHVFCDLDTSLPESWKVTVNFQNVYEAGFFGCPIVYRPAEVPDTTVILADDNKRSVFDVDIERPLDRGIFKQGIEMVHAMRALASGKTFMGRPIDVEPYLPGGTDGPLTVAMSLRGPAILVDLFDDPGYAEQLFDFIVTAAIKRNVAVKAYWGLDIEKEEAAGMADDSIALISTELYRQAILPHHRKWFESVDPGHRKLRKMHLCGDATRHFPTLCEELGIASFDTGFPVDFAALRRRLGKDVEILGGVEAYLLQGGSPQDVYMRARAVLTSGILEGRFQLQEANNLPPRVPWANLAAMYKAAFDFGAVARED